MKKLALLMSLIFLVVFAAACGSDSEQTAVASEGDTTNETTTDEEVAEIEVEHQLGTTTVPVNPEKVVVFDYGTLDSLDKLGVEITAIPQDSLPSYLEKYEDAKYENAGGIKEPDFEKLAGIDPDLIIISGRQSEVYEDLNELAPTIYMGVDTSRYMDSFTENVELLGQIFGKEAEVEAELTAINDEITALNEKAIAKSENGLIILTNDGSVSAYGPGSRFGLIHDVFGFAPVDDTLEVSTHGQNVSFEYIAEKDPQNLFVVDRNKVVGGENSAEKTLENELVQKTQAYQNENIIYLSPDYWYLSGGGLISVAGMINEISENIN
ncbi:ABC transporter substrate-binding protein [Aquibacillus halophilus]|uniref:ABC transporter substrate-binding protein n=1 Tax=Aquibacillus halophilus TaxID=930132 RepID=A0A6A8DE36_9BACI|nr:siderophore ABC transporter substrate-binding protein [Aquibacillus halophilus]MRH42109.1 ABC transporter substrate-binding protein [Aquibacillus halophilus]